MSTQMEQLSLFSCEEQVEWQHERAKGFVVVARKNEYGFRQISVPAPQIKTRIKALCNKWNAADVWISQNSFFKADTRRVDDIGQLLHLYTDVDCYKLGLTAQQVYEQIRLDFVKRSIPEPSAIIFSGQGLQLIWRIVPESAYSMPVWQYVNDYLVETLLPVGADTASGDAARILRVAATTNQKNGAVVEFEWLHDRLFTLTEIIQDYIVPNTQPQEPRKAPGKVSHIVSPQRIKDRPKADEIKAYTIHWHRMRDMAILVKLRAETPPDTMGKKQGKEWGRQTLLFLHRYYSCMYYKQPVEAMEATLALNQVFKYPCPEEEVLEATHSAEKMFLEWLEDDLGTKVKSDAKRAKGYPGHGYFYSNARLIRLLDIQPEEMRHLEITIDKAEKSRRRIDKRRTQGRPDRRGGQAPSLSRQEYLFDCVQAIADNVTKAKALSAQGMTQRQIAAVMSISVSTVNSYLKK